MRSVISLLPVAMLIGAGTPVSSHHSIARFDGSRKVRIEGVVTAWRWVNPHATIEMDGHAAGSSSTRWIVEMRAPTAMMDEGWERSALSVGDALVVFANPLRDPDACAVDPCRALYAGAILPGGRSLGSVPEQRGGEG